MLARHAKLAKGRSIGRKLVSYDGRWRNTVLPEQFAHQFESCRLVAPGLDQKIQDFALCIDGTLEIHSLAVDRHKYLVQVPTIVRFRPEALKAPRIAASDF